MKTYSDKDLQADLDKIRFLFGTKEDVINEVFNDHESELDENGYEVFKFKQFNTPSGRLWQLTKQLSKGNSNKWNSIFRQLGYVGLYDPGMSVIHSSEPTQCVIFETTSVILVKTILNPRAENPVLEHGGNKQDIKNIEKTINRTSRYNEDAVYEMGFNNDIISLSTKDLFNYDEIINNYNDEEIKDKIDSLPLSPETSYLKVLYHDLYDYNAQVDNLVAVARCPENIKLISIENFISALHNIGIEGLYLTLIRSKFYNSNNIISLLKKVFVKNSKKYSVRILDRNLITNPPVFLDKNFKEEDKVVLSEEIVTLYIIHRPGLFEKMGGPVGLSDQQKESFIAEWSRT